MILFNKIILTFCLRRAMIYVNYFTAVMGASPDAVHYPYI